ncbi:hypothetical protein PVMG_05346 [Plasmodium vivax Mauritania I]|uniref:PIR Superfamily Protein n=1 Tax=Plasmodium vivax Mauritania I TaxID=1035515 RepID=A0A0J9TLY2_PLAVI|nr:hypothetical protein PVMG_05346 [Plasmodium vivax Mauritania I]
MYEDFEKNISDDENALNFYDPTCKVILRTRSCNNLKYNEFCMKLLRNLGAHSKDPIIYKPNHERCKNLYNWLYYLIMKHNIPDYFISKIFQESKDIVGAEQNEKMCSYNKYSEFLDKPEEMLKIYHFNDNIYKIKDILMDNEHTNNCSCRRYIYECVRIYKEMNTKYCSSEDNKKNKYQFTCSQLDLFKNFYGIYFTSNQDLIDTIPSLHTNTVEHYFICPSSKSDKELVDVKNEQGSSSTLPTAIGTMAGVSSVIAFLYKVHTNFNLII